LVEVAETKSDVRMVQQTLEWSCVFWQMRRNLLPVSSHTLLDLQDAQQLVELNPSLVVGGDCCPLARREKLFRLGFRWGGI
jgi:hypothetical protein